ncbi:glycosyltransferase [Solirubrobacter deserti]|uniref:Glycosyltransferase n=1 Tax=Solirubrobacter deserti TaxID=2282478 RepID=A0ABT4RLZ6_9ACTN|nr:glycosyltransferase [Solirubrobacter deserti]MDA0139601.1 glycosyltransferase [Solirubrobacter deserti]
MDGDTLLGGEPFQLVRLRPESRARIRAWEAGEPVGDGGALARDLVMANLAQPLPPPLQAKVSVVIPTRDRTPLAVPDADEVIVVDDGSDVPGATIRRATRGGAAAARNHGLRAARNELVALLDSDTVPQPGWLEPLLAHFNDPLVDIVAPRIVPLKPGGYEARRSPLDRGPDAARVVPYGRVPFVPGAALLVRHHVRFDETLTSGGEDVELVWRTPYVRYEPAAHVAHAHRTEPRAWFARRVYYGRTAARVAQRHPGEARPLHVSPWTTAAWAAALLGRPYTAAAITATATALLARDTGPQTAAQLAALGTLRSGRVVADALTRHWWPLAALHPRTRLAFLTKPPLAIVDDLAYGTGVWLGCVERRTIDPLLPARPWKLARRTL